MKALYKTAFFKINFTTSFKIIINLLFEFVRWSLLSFYKWNPTKVLLYKWYFWRNIFLVKWNAKVSVLFIFFISVVLLLIRIKVFDHHLRKLKIILVNQLIRYFKWLKWLIRNVLLLKLRYFWRIFFLLILNRACKMELCSFLEIKICSFE